MGVMGRNLLIALILPVAFIQGVLAQQQFVGKLRAKLVPSEQTAILHWDAATPKDMTKFTRRPESSATVRVGTLELGERNDLKFAAALVKMPGRQPCLYVDRDHRDIFSESGRVCFRVLPAGSPYAAEAEIELPLSYGPYHSFPISLELPLAGTKDPHDNTTPTIMPSLRALVMGKVALSGRSLLVGYVYDPDKGTANPAQCLQFADLNNDGKLNELSERDMGEKGVAPVFHVGSLYLRATSVDLARKRVTLTSVLKSEYKRFDLWPGAMLPDFNFQTLDGRAMKLSDVKGRLVLLDFWATWCPACVADLPSKRAIYAKYHSRGFEILGLDGDAGVDKPKRLVEKLGLTWPQGKPSGELLEERFHITSWPTAVLLDEHGRVLTRDLGKLSGDNLAKTLDQLLPTK